IGWVAASTEVFAQRVLAGKISPRKALADDSNLRRVGTVCVAQQPSVAKRDIHHAKITRGDVLNDGILLLAALIRRVLPDRKKVFIRSAAIRVRNVRHHRSGLHARKAVQPPKGSEAHAT